jgi:hypothetical protein
MNSTTTIRTEVAVRLSINALFTKNRGIGTIVNDD